MEEAIIIEIEGPSGTSEGESIIFTNREEANKFWKWLEKNYPERNMGWIEGWAAKTAKQAIEEF